MERSFLKIANEPLLQLLTRIFTEVLHINFYAKSDDLQECQVKYSNERV